MNQLTGKSLTSTTIIEVLDAKGELHLNAAASEALIKLLKIDEQRLISACLLVDHIRAELSRLKSSSTSNS